MTRWQKIGVGATLLIWAAANAALGAAWTFINPTPNQTFNNVNQVVADGVAYHSSATLTLAVKSSGNNTVGGGGATTAGTYYNWTWSGSATPVPAPWPYGIHHIILYESGIWKAEQYINFQ